MPTKVPILEFVKTYFCCCCCCRCRSRLNLLWSSIVSLLLLVSFTSFASFVAQFMHILVAVFLLAAFERVSTMFLLHVIFALLCFTNHNLAYTLTRLLTSLLTSRWTILVDLLCFHFILFKWIYNKIFQVHKHTYVHTYIHSYVQVCTIYNIRLSMRAIYKLLERQVLLRLMDFSAVVFRDLGDQVLLLKHFMKDAHSALRTLHIFQV